MPECFWQADAFGCKGSVEFGFLSTARQKEVAVKYLRGQKVLLKIFESSVGQVNCAASLEMPSP